MLRGDNTTRPLRRIANTRELNNRIYPHEGIVISIECGTGSCPVDGLDVEPEPEDEVLDPEGGIKD